ncbi:MAG: membrane protein insertion efficiency factor YidD [Planctomycetaceae bacterium]|nr:membrane protein insertion efficiency factor YidD [Planctomycetaceae bacterium]
MRIFVQIINRILSCLLIFLALFYQVAISPLIKAFFGDVCKFTPSCSQYFIEAVRKYGAIRGTIKGIWRVVRCNPWNRGGYDPP